MTYQVTCAVCRQPKWPILASPPTPGWICALCTEARSTPGVTDECRAALEAFRRQVGEIRPAVRVVKDSEGWPQVLGRHGRMEWHDGAMVAAFTTGRVIRGKLLALPGVRRHQTGDQELRVLVEPQAIPAVAALLRLRRKRVLTGDALEQARERGRNLSGKHV